MLNTLVRWHRSIWWIVSRIFACSSWVLPLYPSVFLWVRLFVRVLLLPFLLLRFKNILNLIWGIRRLWWRSIVWFFPRGCRCTVWGCWNRCRFFWVILDIYMVGCCGSLLVWVISWYSLLRPWFGRSRFLPWVGGSRFFSREGRWGWWGRVGRGRCWCLGFRWWGRRRFWGGRLGLWGWDRLDGRGGASCSLWWSRNRWSGFVLGWSRLLLNFYFLSGR